MKIKFHGAAGIVTGSCHELTITKGRKKYHYLLDCGLFQGRKETTKRNFEPFTFDPKKINAVILSHAHLDHCGLIPKLYKKGFRGKIHCTKATRDLVRIMLEDSGKIQERETEYDNKHLKKEGKPLRKPLYTMEDARQVMDHFIGYDYDKIIHIDENICIVFRDAGHILGSAIIEIIAKEDGKRKKIVFSGDLGKWDSQIVKDPTLLKMADYVIIESTYGSRFHETKKVRNKILIETILQIQKTGGKLLIPAFALERTQEILYMLNELIEDKIVPGIKVFVDSPLATKATRIFERHTEAYDEEAQMRIADGDNIFKFPNLKLIEKVSESKKLNDLQGPAIIIAGSGMCNAGRIKHHIIHHANKTGSMMVFVSYQAQGTLGRRIRSGKKRVKIYGRWINLKLQIKSIGGFSAHADQPSLIRWAKSFRTNPKFVLVHGERKEQKVLASKMREFTDKIHIPNIGDEIELV